MSTCEHDCCKENFRRRDIVPVLPRRQAGQISPCRLTCYRASLLSLRCLAEIPLDFRTPILYHEPVKRLFLLFPLAVAVSCTEPRLFTDDELPVLEAIPISILGGCHQDVPPGVSEARKAECRRALARAEKTQDNAACYEWECKAWMAYPTPGCCDIPGADQPSFPEKEANGLRIQAKYAKLMEERARKEDSLVNLFAFCHFDIDGDGAEEKALRRRQQELQTRYLEKREEFRRAAMAMLYPRLAALPELQGTDEQTLAAAPCTFDREAGIWDACGSFDFSIRDESTGKDTPRFIRGTVYGANYPKEVVCHMVNTSLVKDNCSEQHAYQWKNGAWEESTAVSRSAQGVFAAKRALVEERDGERMLTVYDDHTGDIVETFVLDRGKYAKEDSTHRDLTLPFTLHHIHGNAYRLKGDERRHCSLQHGEITN